MSKKLIKIATGITTGISTFYWGALPAFAVVNLCDQTTTTGNISALCTGTIEGLIKTVLNTALFVAFVAALVYLIWGGINWIMSGGDKEGTSKAKEKVTSALIGLAVVLGSWVLINIITTFFLGTGISNLATPTLKLN